MGDVSYKQAIENNVKYIQKKGCSVEVESALIQLSKCLAWKQLDERIISTNSPKKKPSGIVNVIFEFSYSALINNARDITEKEDSELSLNVALAAERLSSHISDGVFFGINSQPYREALDSILMGVINTSIKTSLNDERMFSKEVEEELESKYAENEHIKSSHAAYVYLRYGADDEILSILENLAKDYRESSQEPFGYPRPNSVGHKENSLAIKLNHLFDRCYSSPLHEVVCEFTSAVFNKDIEADKLKKFWSRNKDKDIYYPYISSND